MLQRVPADAETTMQIYADATKKLKHAAIIDLREYLDGEDYGEAK